MEFLHDSMDTIIAASTILIFLNGIYNIGRLFEEGDDSNESKNKRQQIIAYFLIIIFIISIIYSLKHTIIITHN